MLLLLLLRDGLLADTPLSTTRTALDAAAGGPGGSGAGARVVHRRVLAERELRVERRAVREHPEPLDGVQVRLCAFGRTLGARGIDEAHPAAAASVARVVRRTRRLPQLLVLRVARDLCAATRAARRLPRVVHKSHDVLPEADEESGRRRLLAMRRRSDADAASARRSGRRLLLWPRRRRCSRAAVDAAALNAQRLAQIARFAARVIHRIAVCFRVGDLRSSHLTHELLLLLLLLLDALAARECDSWGGQ